MNRLLQFSTKHYLSRPQKITCCALVALTALTNSPIAHSFLVRSATVTTIPPQWEKKRMMSSSSSSGTGATATTTTQSMGSLTIVQVPCLNDNYGYLIHDATSGCTAIVDTPEASPYTTELQQRGWTLTHILNTHHHWDHTGANEELKSTHSSNSNKKQVQIIGPVNEQSKIPGIDTAVGAGDVIELGSTKATVMDVGGHTKGHIAYYFPEEKVVFVGDSLFALGCGRM